MPMLKRISWCVEESSRKPLAPRGRITYYLMKTPRIVLISGTHPKAPISLDPDPMHE
jgi:hypothetical protein